MSDMDLEWQISRAEMRIEQLRIAIAMLHPSQRTPETQGLKSLLLELERLTQMRKKTAVPTRASVAIDQARVALEPCILPPTPTRKLSIASIQEQRWKRTLPRSAEARDLYRRDRQQVHNAPPRADRKIQQSVCWERPEEIPPARRDAVPIEASSYWAWVPCSESWGCPLGFALVRCSFSPVHS